MITSCYPARTAPDKLSWNALLTEQPASSVSFYVWSDWHAREPDAKDRQRRAGQRRLYCRSTSQRRSTSTGSTLSCWGTRTAHHLGCAVARGDQRVLELRLVGRTALHRLFKLNTSLVWDRHFLFGHAITLIKIDSFS